MSPTDHPRGLVPFIKLMGTVARMHNFLLGVSSLTEARRYGLIAGSKSHMLVGEFAKLVKFNDTTGLHLLHYSYAERIDTYEEFNRAAANTWPLLLRKMAPNHTTSSLMAISRWYMTQHTRHQK